MQSARTRFLQRSKSHDEPSESPSRQRDKTASAVHTGRIHRQGGRIVHSRSPSVSPSTSPRPSFRRKKGPRDLLEDEDIVRREDHQGRRVSSRCLDPGPLSPISSSSRKQMDSDRVVTEKGLWQRLASAEEQSPKPDGQKVQNFNYDQQKLQELTNRLSGPLSPVSQDESLKDSDRASRSAAESSVSFSSLDTVISPFTERPTEVRSPNKDEKMDGIRRATLKCSTGPIVKSSSEVENSGFGGSFPDTPTRRTAIRIPQGYKKKSDLMSPENDEKKSLLSPVGKAPQLPLSALDQIKTYSSPAQSPSTAESPGVMLGHTYTSPIETVTFKSQQVAFNNALRGNKDADLNGAKSDPFILQSSQKPQYTSTSPALLSPTRVIQSQAPKSQHCLLMKSPSQNDTLISSPHPPSPTQPSPTTSPTRRLSNSGSSSQTSPSHVTSFSSSPNDSPVRKPSFSSSQTSPTRKISYSSSSAADSPTHKLFFSYRNSPSHRTGYISPQDIYGRKTSFSSSSHDSPVRKPSFSSSSDSRNKPTYSSTSSQSSVLSSPTHVPVKNYGTLSPDQSPTRAPLPSRVQLSPPDQGKKQFGTFPIKTGSPSPFPQTSRTRGPPGTSPVTAPSDDPMNVLKYGRPTSPKMDTSSAQFDRSFNIPKSVCSISPGSFKTTDKPPQGPAGQAKVRDAHKPATVGQTQRQSGGSLSVPLKPTSLNLRDSLSRSLNPGASSCITVSSNLPPHPTRKELVESQSHSSRSQSGVLSLVSRFEKKAVAGSRSGGSNGTSRSGGPQSYLQSPTVSSDTGSTQSKSFSSPTYTSPFSSRSATEGLTSPTSRYNYSPPPHHVHTPSLQGLGYRSSSPSNQTALSPFSVSAASTPSSTYSETRFSSNSDTRAYDNYSYHSHQSEDSPVPTSVYVARCDSSDSLSANESSSLLRDEDKSNSQSSLYYADEDIPDAV